VEEYRRAARALALQPEPALLFAPEARQHLGARADSFYAEWAAAAAASLDRLVLVDPPAESSAQALARCAEALREGAGAGAAALYYPQLRVAAARGLSVSPPWPVPPSGHVAGLISRLDRERGAHHTPASTPLQGAVALVGELGEEERVALYRLGLNPLHCTGGRGLEVWGGRTLHPAPQRRFVAHVRLVHRLVRAMRRAAEPLVFAPSTTLLRLALVRALTSVLLQAFRAGALKGTRPEEAFRVRCDDTTHPPGAPGQGLCIAEVSLALAAPAEFIHLTVALAQDGRLEVLG
jgi:phage tail sheath protein FI